MHPTTGRPVVTAAGLADLAQQRSSMPATGRSCGTAELPGRHTSRVAMSVEQSPKYVSRVRKVAASWLRQICRMPQDRVEATLVVVSELLTNAVRHGTEDSVQYLNYSPRPGMVRIQIGNGTTAPPPQPRQTDALAESGRGLLLVDLLVTDLHGDWGYSEDGTTAWVCLPIEGEQPA
ncbi:ATP-binding protein [Streptomyces sp. SGAir0957]